MKRFWSVVVSVLLLAGSAAGPSSAQQLLTSDTEKIDFAQGLLNQAQYTLAIAQFEEFIKEFPASSFLQDAYLGSGECYFFLQQYDKAIEVLQKYLADFPEAKSKGTAQVRLGQCFYMKNNLDESLNHFNAVSADGLTNQFKQTLYFFKGQILAAKDNAEEAAANYKAAAEIPEATAYTAQAYFKWGTLVARTDYNAAIEKYLKAYAVADTSELKAAIGIKQGEAYYLMKHYDEAADVFKKTMEAYPNLSVYPDAVANWYTVLLAQKKNDEIIAHFNQQFKGAVDKAEYQAVYLSAAKAFSASGNVGQAMAVMDKILALAGISEQQKAMVALQKARVLAENGKCADAVTFIDGHLNGDAGIKAPLLLLKGKCHLTLKQYDNSWAAYEQVSRDFAGSPSMTEAFCGMAYVRYGQEQYEVAAGLFMDCYNNGQDETFRRDALYNAYVAYKKTGVDDKTIEIAEQYIKLTPPADHHSDVTLGLSILYTKRQMYDKAGELMAPYLNDADETTRRSAIFQMAYNLQLAGKSEDSLMWYDKMINDGKNDKLTYLAVKNSFMIYLQLKNDDKAAEMMQRAVLSFENNDMPLKTYLWLVEHWQAANDVQKMLDVLAVAEKRFAQDPDFVSVKFFLGQAYRMHDDCKKAFEQYDAVINGDKSGVYKGRARLGKGVCSTGLGDYVTAQKELEQAIVDSPDDAFVAMRARFALAHNAELMKNYEMAVKLYLVVDVLYKDAEYAPMALMRAASIFEEQLNNKKDALSAYTKIVNVYPKSPEAAKAQEKVTQLK